MVSLKKAEREARARVLVNRKNAENRTFGLGQPRLILDVEITKSLYERYGTGEQYVGGRDLVKAGGINAVSWGWWGSDHINVMTTYKDDYEDMMRRVHGLLWDAEFVIGHNFAGYDRPKLNDAFARLGLDFPEYEVVDTLRLSRRAFGRVIPSGNALKDLTEYLGIGKPVDRYNLLVDDLESGNEAAIQRLYDYSRHDIVLTKALYAFLVEKFTGQKP